MLQRRCRRCGCGKPWFEAWNAKFRDIFTALLHLLWGRGARGAPIQITGFIMANHGTEPHGNNSSDHRGTYEGFMAATKWGVILVVLSLILMAVFLV